MQEKIAKLYSDRQVALLLGLSETVIDLLKSSPAYEEIKTALNICWDWLEDKQHSGDEIYSLLDDGTDFKGLFMKMQEEDDHLKKLVWGCIVDAVSFTNWRAYQFDEEEYLPEPIENVDESILQQFLEGFYQIHSDNNEMVNEFILYIKDRNTSIKKEEIMGFIKKI